MPLHLRRSLIPLMHSSTKRTQREHHVPTTLCPWRAQGGIVYTREAQEPDLTLKSCCRDAALLEQNTRLVLNPCVSLPDRGALLLRGASPPFPCTPSHGRHRERADREAGEGVHMPT